MPMIPFALQWVIPETQLTILKDSVNGELRSSAVPIISGAEYFLQMYPNGHNDDYRGHAWMILHIRLGSFKNIEAECTVTVESAGCSEKVNLIYEQSYGWGIFGCSTQELFDPEKKYIVDGQFAIKIHGVFKVDDTSVVLEEQMWNGAEVCDKLWQNDDDKDFTIVAGGKEIKVHKMFLGAQSTVFTAMFNSTMKESIENKVEISDFSFETVQTAILFIYECNFITSLSMNDAISLLQFFDKYDIPALKSKMETLLINQISPSTVCRLTNHSILANSSKLKEKCIEFLKASKTPLSDIDELDKDIVFKIFKDSLFHTIVQPE